MSDSFLKRRCQRWDSHKHPLGHALYVPTSFEAHFMYDEPCIPAFCELVYNRRTLHLQFQPTPPDLHVLLTHGVLLKLRSGTKLTRQSQVWSSGRVKPSPNVFRMSLVHTPPLPACGPSGVSGHGHNSWNLSWTGSILLGSRWRSFYVSIHESLNLLGRKAEAHQQEA